MTFRNLSALAALAVLAPAYVIACAADPGDAPKGLTGAGSSPTVSVTVGNTSSSTSNIVYGSSGTQNSSTTGIGNTGFTSSSVATSSGLGSTTSASSSSTTVTPPCTTCTLQLTYLAVSTMAMAGSVGFNIQVLNSGTGTQDLSQVTIRYYFTTDTQMALAGQVNTASVKSPGPPYYSPITGVTMTFTTMATPTATADTYLELGFPAGASLPPGGTAEVDVQFHAGNNQGTFNQSNDYSFNGNDTAYTPSNTITLYVSGMLVSGTEPS